jgi:hypothetical protein
MEALCSSETSVATQRTTRRHIPEDDTLHNHRCENLKSYKRKQDCKSGKTVFLGVLRKKLKHAVIQKYFFLEILINVKAGRVK